MKHSTEITEWIVKEAALGTPHSTIATAAAIKFGDPISEKDVTNIVKKRKSSRKG